MKQFDVQGIEIRASKQKVFRFVSEPSNLPRWTNAFGQADATKALLRTASGEAEIGLDTEADADLGTVDWRLSFPDGGVALAQSRVTETTRGTSIYTFVLHAPPVPLEQLEGALEQQMGILREELHRLKSLLES